MVKSNKDTDGKATDATKKTIKQPEHYAFWRFVLDVVQRNKKKTFSFQELLSRYKEEYPHVHRSRQTYLKQLKKIRFVLAVHRSDQLYISFSHSGKSLLKEQKDLKELVDNKPTMTRDRLFKKYTKYCFCSSCGNNNKNVLQLHHINGRSKDHRVKNLSVLCANCHFLIHKGIGECVSLHNQLNPEKVPSMHGQTLSKKTEQSNLIHSSHRWRFSIEYRGEQPLEGGRIRPFGRYKTAKQSTFVFEGDNLTIISFKKRLNVWIHRPTGALTEHQRIKARERAYLALLQFSRKHEIKLEGDIKNLMASHHVVEHPALNDALKPVYAGREAEIEDAIGSHVCLSSHPGKIEHTGIPGKITGYQVGKNLEYLCTLFPGQFSQLAQVNMEFRENLVSHLAIMQDIGRTLKEMRDALKK